MPKAIAPLSDKPLGLTVQQKKLFKLSSIRRVGYLFCAYFETPQCLIAPLFPKRLDALCAGFKQCADYGSSQNTHTYLIDARRGNTSDYRSSADDKEIINQYKPTAATTAAIWPASRYNQETCSPLSRPGDALGVLKIQSSADE